MESIWLLANIEELELPRQLLSSLLEQSSSRSLQPSSQVMRNKLSMRSQYIG